MLEKRPEYIIRPIQTGQSPSDWNDPLWASANELRIDSFHPRSSGHRPTTRVRLLYSPQTLHILFRVSDQFVICRQHGWQAAVCRDSCVEAFLRPKIDAPAPNNGYFNFETNCAGSMLLFYIEDSMRVPGGFAKFTKLPPQVQPRIGVHHSLPDPIDPERTEPIDWQLQLDIPLSIMEPYIGPLGKLAGQRWRANFLKCADDSSHPHWGSWSSIGEQLNFHQPDQFGTLVFGE